MKLKTKLLALGLLVVASGLASASAGATNGGHFGSDKGLTTLVVVEQGEHQIEMALNGNTIYCNGASYHGVAVGMQFTSITLTPKYEECETTGSSEVEIETNDCTFVFTVHPEPEVKHSTVHLECVTGQAIEISHPNCLMRIPPQTFTGAVYTAAQWEGTKALTVDLTAGGVKTNFEGGICQFLGTAHQGELTGAAIFKAWDAEEPKKGANLTVTGTTP